MISSSVSASSCRHGGGELGEVVGERGDERALRAPVIATSRGRELGVRRSRACRCRASVRRRRSRCRRPFRRGSRRAASCRAPRRRAAARGRCRRRALRGSRAPRRGTRRVHLLDAVDADEPRLAEQARAREGDQLAGRVVGGVEFGDLERRIFGFQDVAQQPDRAIGEHRLGAVTSTTGAGRTWSHVSCGIATLRRRAPPSRVPPSSSFRRFSDYPARRQRDSRQRRRAVARSTPAPRRALAGATRMSPSRSVRVGRRADRREDAEQRRRSGARSRCRRPRRSVRPWRERLVQRRGLVGGAVVRDLHDVDVPGTGRAASSRSCDSSPRSPRKMPLRHPRAAPPASPRS